MVGADADFSEYAAARRTDLVRLTTLLGVPPAHAAVLADRALAAARRRWPRVRDDGDPDGSLLDLLLEQKAADRTPWWEEGAADLPADLVRELDAMTVRERAAVVWTALGHADHEVGAELRGRLLAAAAGCVVPPPTGAEPTRRDRRPLLVGLVAVVLVAGLAVALGLPGDGPSPEPPLEAVDVVEQVNRAPVAWYADGRVHLERTLAPVEDVRALVEMGAGAVYLDGDGRVVRLDGDGGRQLLGRAAVDLGLVGSAVFGRVAFVTEDLSALEVVDVAEAQLVARRDLEGSEEERAGLRLVRMTGSVLRWTQADRELEWDTVGQTFQSDLQGEDEGALVDVVGGTELRQLDPETIRISQSLGEPLVVLGSGGEVSPRQQFVLTRTGGGGTGVRVFAVGTGEDLATGTTEQDIVLDARFTAPDVITYLLADREAVPDPSGAGRTSSTGPLEVRSCQVGTARCTVDAVGTGAGDSSAVLAR